LDFAIAKAGLGFFGRKGETLAHLGADLSQLYYHASCCARYRQILSSRVQDNINSRRISDKSVYGSVDAELFGRVSLYAS